MSNVNTTRIPSVMPAGSGVVFGVPAFAPMGGYVCAATATKCSLGFGRTRIATDAEQHPGTQVWSPPT